MVIDEQHRFGVEQRDALRAKAAGNRPHVLVMTATPIPRTVAMTVYGDLETSTLTELPAGRSAIASHVVPAADKPRYLERAWERVREEVGQGRQAYVVCPRVGDDTDTGSGSGSDDDAAYADEDLDDGLVSQADLDAGVVRHMDPDGGVARRADLDGGEARRADLDGGMPRGVVNGRRQPLAVLDVAATLDAGPLAGLRLGILHGRLPRTRRTG